MKQILLYASCLLTVGCSSNTQSNVAGNSTPPIASSICPDKPDQPLTSQNVQPISLSEQATEVEGFVSQSKQLGYAFNAKSGQSVNYQTDDEICTWIYTPDNQLLETGQLPKDGKYILQVSAPKGSKTFHLKLSLGSTQPLAQSTKESGQPTNTSTDGTKQAEERDPEKFVRQHYEGLNQRNYELTWTDLSTDFKAIAGGYSAYTEWWEQVANIQLISTRVVSQESNSAVIDANLQYHMKSGNTVHDNKGRIYLEWNSEEKHWDIVNKVAP
jgi:hypothetical protein